MNRFSKVRSGAVFGFLAGLMVAASGPATASGLPMRFGAPAPDRALAILGEDLQFKLARLDGAAPEAWAAVVDEVVLVAAKLGFPSDDPVSGQRTGNTYMILREGRGIVSGADPDRVLGRLLYDLSRAGASPSSAALAVLDQGLTTTLSTLASSPTP